MNYKAILHNYKQFFPNPENKVLIYYKKKTLEEVIGHHYENISPTISIDMSQKFIERGFLKTITGKKIYNLHGFTSLDVLIYESTNDVWKLLSGSFNSQELESIFCICNKEEIGTIKANCQEIIESLKLRIRYWIDFKVVYDENDNS